MRRAGAWLPALVLLGAACSPSEEEFAAARVEATTDFAAIDEALREVAAETGEFPFDLDDLDLPVEIAEPSNDAFSYRYRSSAEYSGGPICNYRLEAYFPTIDSSEPVTDRTGSVCDPADLTRVREASEVALEDARSEFPVLEEALERYYQDNGVYPPTLEDLGLTTDEIEPLGRGVYHYHVHDGYAADELKPDEICSFWLELRTPVSVGREPRIVGDRCPS